jgi:preprotein translocase subunit Sss1
MVVAEILTGIALVQKSVEFIKSNIGTVNDIKDIAKQIDGFFLGEEQMNKGQGKGMSIMEQFGSVESSATDYIDRKLLEEKRQELKQLINLRFGPQSWDQIIAERADRIAKAKEAQRQARIEAKRKQDEILEVIKWVGYGFIIIGLILGLTVVAVKVYAKDYTRNQKINNGVLSVPKMTTCRLKKQKVFKDKMACIYVGAQKTYELEFTDIHVGCPRNYQCVFNPNGQEPSIDKVMESLRSIAK